MWKTLLLFGSLCRMTPCINLPDFVHTFHQQVFSERRGDSLWIQIFKKENAFTAVYSFACCLLYLEQFPVVITLPQPKKYRRNWYYIKIALKVLIWAFRFMPNCRQMMPKPSLFKTMLNPQIMHVPDGKYRQLATISEATKQVCLCLVSVSYTHLDVYKRQP